MNTYLVTVDEECGEVRITTGITPTEDAMTRMVYGLMATLAAEGPTGHLVRHEANADPMGICIEEGSPLYVEVGKDRDERLVVNLYNTMDLRANGLINVLAYITNFQA